MVGIGRNGSLKYHAISFSSKGEIIWMGYKSIAMLPSALILPLPIYTSGWRTKGHHQSKLPYLWPKYYARAWTIRVLTQFRVRTEHQPLGHHTTCKSLYKPSGQPSGQDLSPGVFLLPPGLDASPLQDYPSIKFVGTHLYNWVERCTVRVKCLAQEHNTMSTVRAGSRTAQSQKKLTSLRDGS